MLVLDSGTIRAKERPSGEMPACRVDPIHGVAGVTPVGSDSSGANTGVNASHGIDTFTRLSQCDETHLKPFSSRPTIGWGSDTKREIPTAAVAGSSQRKVLPNSSTGVARSGETNCVPSDFAS